MPNEFFFTTRLLMMTGKSYVRTRPKIKTPAVGVSSSRRLISVFLESDHGACCVKSNTVAGACWARFMAVALIVFAFSTHQDMRILLFTFINKYN
jgi:hypothetical protein